MSNNNNNNNNSGWGILPVLGVIFITLKLCGVINWSWWWVTAPFWGGLVIAVGFLVIGIALIVWGHRKGGK